MRIYVYEHITGGGMRNQELPASLAREGDLMLNALAGDLSTLPNVEVIVSRDDRLQNSPLAGSVEQVRVSENDSRFFESCTEIADAVWPIAPETDGVLFDICRSVVDTGTILLNSRPVSVALTSSKYRTFTLLDDRSIPVIHTFHLQDIPEDSHQAWVLKPDDGVGCEGAQYFESAYTLLDHAMKLGLNEAWVAQPYVEGDAISMILLCSEGRARLLSCNRQHVERINERFVLKGCTVGDSSLPHHALAEIGMRVAACIPRLWGIVGVDLILSNEGPLVLEINPRLTSSYAGLNAVMNSNPAALVIELQQTGNLPAAAEAEGTFDPVMVRILD